MWGRRCAEFVGENRLPERMPDRGNAALGECSGQG